jgi:hypothetical protein
MYNRKFNVKKDFSELIELEHKIMPIIREIKNDDQKLLLSNYVRKIFNNQYKL